MSGVLAERLSSVVTSLAFCWKLTRSDGLVVGLTSHDRDLYLGGVGYRSSPGLSPSALTQANDLSADSMEIEGVLDSAAITEFDLVAGRWAWARAELFAVDWAMPETQPIRLLLGEVGEISRPLLGMAGAFQAELLSDTARIREALPLRVSSMCRAELGDGRCGVDLDGRSVDAVLLSAAESQLVLTQPLSNSAAFAFGRLRFLNGPLCGLDWRIAQISGATVYLEDGLQDADLIGSRLRLWEGCDKSLASCAGRFANAAAFDGEPHVPGSDALLRYVGS